MDRIDAIMLGTAPLDYGKVKMQLDSMQGKRELSGQTAGHKGATLEYRKIEGLEFDPLFLDYMQAPVFRHICVRAYGERTAISSFRAMFMNKPARGGTRLTWHQDRWTHMSPDPLITVWTALDPATVANGCVEIIAGSHLKLINPEHNSGFLTEKHIEEIVRPARQEYLELKAGESALLHNWTLHSSAVNGTDAARRAFSVCYMPATTVSSRGNTFNQVFGPEALTLA